MRALPLSLVFLFVMLSILPGSSGAGEGKIEINQICAVQTGCHANDAASFPVTIDSPGSYVLTSDLVVGANETAISVTGARVTIDLNGFSIRGPVTCTGAGVNLSCLNTGTGIGISASGISDVSVRGGRIQGTGARPIILGPRGTIEDVVIDSCGAGVSCSNNCRVRRSSVGRVIGTALSVSLDSQVAETVVSDSSGSGIVTLSGSLVRNNTVTGNSLRGIDVNTGCTVVENAVYNNGDDGIEVTAGSLVARNSVRLNGGIGLDLDLLTGYGQNVMSLNGGAEVDSGVDLGGNACDGGDCTP